jgi:hypothetical protein
VLIVEELGVVEIRSLDMGRRALRDYPKIGRKRVWITFLQTLISLPKSFSDNTSERLTCCLGDSLGEAVRLGVFYG